MTFLIGYIIPCLGFAVFCSLEYHSIYTNGSFSHLCGAGRFPVMELTSSGRVKMTRTRPTLVPAVMGLINPPVTMKGNHLLPSRPVDSAVSLMIAMTVSNRPHGFWVDTGRALTRSLSSSSS